jgi:hypothetical protein
MVYVENEAAYIRATEARIAANRVKGGYKRFSAAHADADVLIDYVESRVSDAQIAYGLNKRPDASFIDACWVGIRTFGGLTDNQAQAVRNSIAKAAERKAAAKAADALSEHVGIIGARSDFELVLTFYTSFDGTFGTTHIHGFKDATGNVFIYKGIKKLPVERGEQIKIKATIKEHGIRDGVKQTILARPA